MRYPASIYKVEHSQRRCPHMNLWPLHAQTPVHKCTSPTTHIYTCMHTTNIHVKEYYPLLCALSSRPSVCSLASPSNAHIKCHPGCGSFWTPVTHPLPSLLLSDRRVSALSSTYHRGSGYFLPFSHTVLLFRIQGLYAIHVNWHLPFEIY